MENATPVGSGTLPTTDAAPDLTGKTLGDYHILRRLGTGGMGQVYLAEQISLMRKVALKLLRADLAANAKSLDRFKQEAFAVAQATHANIVQVYAIGDFEGLHFMALEYVEGRNLREYLERKGPPELLVSLSIMRQVAAALQRAGELGIIHRDIKPENILITKKGEVKVADFGLSRVYSENAPAPSLTQSGVSMGTPLYMSPEQVEAKKNIDCRTDIYSFGVTSYHLLAGQPPFRGDNAWEVATQHVQKEPPPLAEIRPDLPADLCGLVHKMMAKSPDDRPQTAREIVRELVRLRDLVVGVTGAPGGHTSGLHWIGSAIALGPVPPNAADAASTQHVVKPRRSRALVWLAVLSVVLAAAAGLFAGWRHTHSDADDNGDVKIVNPSPAPADPARLREADLRKKYDDTKELNAAIDLSAFLLKERSPHSLIKALDFSRDLEKDSTASLRALGFLNHAMVLSYQDYARPSNLLFMAVLLGSNPGPIDDKYRPLTVAEVKSSLQKSKKGPLGPLRLLLENPEIPDMIADALAVAHKDEPRQASLYFMKNMLGIPKEKTKLPAGNELTLKDVMKKPALKPVLESPTLREVIADALHHNRGNLPVGGKKKSKDESDPDDAYPRILKELRRPWNPS
jgi:serine/threonine-protein kinase